MHAYMYIFYKNNPCAPVQIVFQQFVSHMNYCLVQPSIGRFIFGMYVDFDEKWNDGVLGLFYAYRLG